MRRYDSKSSPKNKLWRKVKGDIYIAGHYELRMAIKESGLSESDLKRKLGHGYQLLEDALAGRMLTETEAYFVENGIKNTQTVNPYGNAESFNARSLPKLSK